MFKKLKVLALSLLAVAAIALPTFAATHSEFVTGNVGGYTSPGTVKFYHARIDMSDLSSAGASSDVIEVFKVPAGAFVIRVSEVISTAEGATATALVGDGADNDGWCTALDLNAAAGTHTDAYTGTDAAFAATGKFYSTADTIDLTLQHSSVDTAVVDVYVMYSVLAFPQ